MPLIKDINFQITPDQVMIEQEFGDDMSMEEGI